MSGRRRAEEDAPHQLGKAAAVAAIVFGIALFVIGVVMAWWMGT